MAASPTSIAVSVAVLTGLGLSLLALDPERSEYLRSWNAARALVQDVWNGVIHVLAVLVVAAAAQGVGWTPSPTDPGWKNVLLGVSWAVAGTAVLRAEITGFRSEEVGPSGSILRSALRRINDTSSRRARIAVRRTLDAIGDPLALYRVGIDALDAPARPRATDLDTRSVRDATRAALYGHYDLATATEAGRTRRIDGMTDLRKTIEDLVDKHNVPRARVRGLT